MLENSKLKNLLREFNVKGYADSNSKYVDNGKNGKILNLSIDEYRYEDEFYGGEPYCGNETIWEGDKDVFRCVYWGKVVKGVNFSDIYDFLRKALMKGPNGELVHRGPIEYVEGNLKYTNNVEGEIDEFRQVEKIFIDEKEVYVAYFVGGRVNVQKE
mgnify:FL=1